MKLSHLASLALPLICAILASCGGGGGGGGSTPPSPPPGGSSSSSSSSLSYSSTDGAVFSNIRMSSEDQVSRSGAAGLFANPIQPGYYPDPSIERVGDDFYMIHSTFAHYPGIPVFHSKDLVNWTQIGNAIDRPDMLDFTGLKVSEGVFAPAISHHDGIFYIINTCVGCRGNFVITATDPAGPWSDPVWLPFWGIDPSIYFDDDDRAWIVWNDAPEGTALYDGHRAIWIQEFNYKTMSMVGAKKQIVNGGIDLSAKPVWIEGPHLYKVDGKYYLSAAEGGTSVWHSQVVLVSDKVDGPYVPWGINPILTQRDLPADRSNPISAAGHADLVQLPNGDWWAVFLATRPYAEDYYNTGRETFLLPVTWKKDKKGVKGPVILEKGVAIPHELPRPALPASGSTQSLTVMGYTSANAMKWLFIRNPVSGFFDADSSGNLTLRASRTSIGQLSSSPAFMGLRQQGPLSTFEATIDARPGQGGRAGILSVQNDEYWFFCGIEGRGGGLQAVAYRRSGASDPLGGVRIASIAIEAAPRKFATVVTNGQIACKYETGGGLTDLTPAGTDGRFLSTNRAGGFVGTVTGVYATRP